MQLAQLLLFFQRLIGALQLHQTAPNFAAFSELVAKKNLFVPKYAYRLLPEPYNLPHRRSEEV